MVKSQTYFTFKKVNFFFFFYFYIIMVVENNIEISEGTSFGIFALSSSSSSCLLLIILIIVGVYFYYKSKNINILEKFPFLKKIQEKIQEIPYLKKIQEKIQEIPLLSSDNVQDSEGKLVYKEVVSLSGTKPKAILATSSQIKTFDKNASNQMLLQQAPDKCSSVIADGLCGNLVKGDSSLTITNDGNLVLKKSNTILWDSFTNKDRPNTTYTLNLTNNGNLILLDNNWSIIWSNNSNGKKEDGPYMLILRDDSNLVIENNANKVVWETGTAGGKVSSILEDRGNTGYIPSDPSIWLLYKEKSSSLPSSFKIETPFEATDQYDVSSCVPSQILGIFSYNYWKLYTSQYFFSRLFTFYYARADAGADPKKNDGCDSNGVYNCIRNRGLLLEKHYKYDGTTASGESGTKNLCSVQKYQEKPQGELDDIAKKNIPIFRIYRIDRNNDLLTVLKTAIYNGMPVLFAIQPYTSYWSSHTNQTGEITYPDKLKEERLKSQHQVSMWGWDDSKEVFHVLNTRGKDYYNKGWNTIPYKYIQDADLSSEFHIIKMDDSTPNIVDDSNYINKEDWVFQKTDGCVYVNTVQRGLQCFEPPPSGYDWTTPGGILIGKICPAGSNDSGTTCWYDRGVGRIPDKKPCDQGEVDTGTTCWVDTYGRGAGRPRDGSCPHGWRNDGTSCWEDAKCNTVDNGYYNLSWGSVNCNGPKNNPACTTTDFGIFGKSTTCAGWNDCYSTWISKLETSCSGCGCIKQGTNYSCNDDEEMSGLLCYPKCKSGYHAVGCCLCEPDGGNTKKWLKDRQYCADDEEMKDGLCYKKCKPGFNAGVTICEFSKDVKSGTFKKAISNCK